MWGTPLSRLQLTIVAILGVSLPLLCAVFLTPLLFSRSVSAGSYERAMLGVKDANASVLPKESGFDDIDGSAEYLSFVSDETLDPDDKELFVVSFSIKLSQIPRLGSRQKLIYKYAANSPPYAGWALALHRTKTSLRPEVYWQGAAGKGGWYTFDEVALDTNAWFTLTLLGKSGKFISLYLEDGSLRNGARSSQPGLSERELSEAAHLAKHDVSHVRFLGGFDVDDVMTPESDGKLFVRSLGSNSGNFRAQIRDVLLGHTPSNFASVSSVEGVLRNGSVGLAEMLGSAGTSLWLDETGADRSRFARNPLVRSKNRL